MKGKWAQGIRPRNFAWILKDRLAVCERPGGYGQGHRRVRRQEEIIWIREQGFTKVVSLLTSPHNLHAYDELDVDWEHLPFDPADDLDDELDFLYTALRNLLQAGERIIVHGDELGDEMTGIVTGYLLWSGLVSEPPKAVAMVERMLERQVGPAGRHIVSVAEGLVRPTSA